MGKNSLVQSTTKGKKNTAKKKTAKKSAAKATPKAKAAANAKPTPQARAAAKPKPSPKPKAAAKAAPASEKKAVSVKDLLKKKFPVWKPEKLYAAGPDKAGSKDVAAPPFFSGPEAEQKRIRELLMKKYDMAEIKAAGEKVAAEKAAAEKAAAEKAAAEKAAAEAAVSVSYEPPDAKDTLPPDPMDKAMKCVAAVVAVLIALVVGSSMINQGKYYIRSTNGALQIYQGRFAPMGEKLLFSLPGVQPPAKIKDVYSQTDIFPIIFNYYVEKADTLLKVPGLPDFNGIKTYINKAIPYALTPKSKDLVYTRLNDIDLMILLYKADVAAGKDTLADLNEAKRFLTEASRLDIDKMKLNLVNQKIDAVDKKIASLKAEQKSAASPPAVPPAKTEAPKPAPKTETKAAGPAPKTHMKTPSPAPHGE
jgi:colicin import membrane protein